MPVTLTGNELHLALTGLRKVVAKKNSIPALSHVLLSACAGDGCTLTGTDLDTTATYRAQEVRGDPGYFRALLPLDDLMRLTKGALRDRVTLNPVSGSDPLEVVLDGPLGQRKHFVNALPAEDYPEMPAAIPVRDCGPGFLAAYRKAAPFASTDETRMVLTGIRVDVEDQATPRLVSTDGRRLCALGLPSAPLESSATLPALKILLWNKVEDPCALGVEGSRFQLETGPWTLKGRLVDGPYPNWRQVVPGKDGSDSFAVALEDMPIFKEAVRTLPIRYPESNEAPLILREVGGQLELSARDTDNNVTVRVMPKSRASDGLLVSVNRNKLLEAVDSGFTAWTLSGSMNPLCSRDGGNIHVLMPLRLDAAMDTMASKAAPATAPAETGAPQPETRNEEPETQIPEPETSHPEPDPMPEETKPKLTISSNPEPTGDPLEELIAKAEEARVQVRDLHNCLRDIIALAKTQKRQERGIRTELQNAKGVLEKLRDIAA